MGLPDTMPWFVDGNPPLDLAATVRFRRDSPIDLVATPEDLARWFVAAGLASSPPPVTERHLEVAKGLREAIYRMAAGPLTGRKRNPRDEDVINEAASVPPPVPVLSGGTVSWSAPRWTPSLLSAVARDAIALMTGPEAGRIRGCAAPRCTRLFVDVSRAKSRRWCSMTECGNRAKVASHRVRRRMA